MKSKKSILIFGVGQLQKSLIERCKMKGLYTVGIDPNPNAECSKNVDAFEVVAGDDYNATITIARNYKVSGIITAATDKPLVMMARVAEELNLPFFSVDTAKISTDKLMMKQKFVDSGLPCAKGFVIDNVDKLLDLDIYFPVIIKPRDNSGSRGVIYCENLKTVASAVEEALQYTQKNDVLIEEFINGKEYSVEAVHYDDEHHIIQITEKTTTNFPYNVELSHVQPADITITQQEDIKDLVKKTAKTLRFKNCASHTEIKINSRGIFIIETSPRLGGDFISSTLVPLSTGVNMEDILIDICMKHKITNESFHPSLAMYSGVKYFNFSNGVITAIDNIDLLRSIKDIKYWNLKLKNGSTVKKITNSLDRYGYAIYQAENRNSLIDSMSRTDSLLRDIVKLQTD